MDKIVVDSNVLIRYLLKDEISHSSFREFD